MNPLQSFGNTMMTGARAIAKGVTSLGKKKQGMAAKMVAPAPKAIAAAPVTQPQPEYNRGFHAYKDRLDEALKY